jgi:toxin FitB
LQAHFAGKILGIGSKIADRWGMLAAAANPSARALSAIDGLLAATALHHNLRIVSRYISDFASPQAPIVKPWDS